MVPNSTGNDYSPKLIIEEVEFYISNYESYFFYQT